MNTEDNAKKLKFVSFKIGNSHEKETRFTDLDFIIAVEGMAKEGMLDEELVLTEAKCVKTNNKAFSTSDLFDVIAKDTEGRYYGLSTREGGFDRLVEEFEMLPELLRELKELLAKEGYDPSAPDGLRMIIMYKHPLYENMDGHTKLSLRLCDENGNIDRSIKPVLEIGMLDLSKVPEFQLFF